MAARKTWCIGLLAAAALLLALGPGCHRRKPAISVDELAALLRAHGVAYEVAETAALPRVQADGLRLTGKGLEVELYRFDDAKDLDLAARAARMAQSASAGTIQAIVRAPFLVVVRAEPKPGQVAAALAQALPKDR